MTTDANITIIRTAPTPEGGGVVDGGEYKKQKMVMPNKGNTDNGIAKAMAEAAAAKYEKDKDKIQKACAEIEKNPDDEVVSPPGAKQTSGCCIIL